MTVLPKIPIAVLALSGATTAALAMTYSFRTHAQPPQASALLPKIAASDYVLIGRVVATKAVLNRLLDERNLNANVGGTVYQVEVERLVCARSDLRPGIPRPKIARVAVFQRRDEPYERRAQWRPGSAFLAFVSAQPRQDQLRARYRLDEDEVYYEASDGLNGLFLAAEVAPTVDQLGRLCATLEPPAAADKIGRLERLAKADEELAPVAGQAIQTIRAHERQQAP